MKFSDIFSKDMTTTFNDRYRLVGARQIAVAVGIMIVGGIFSLVGSNLWPLVIGGVIGLILIINALSYMFP